MDFSVIISKPFLNGLYQLIKIIWSIKVDAFTMGGMTITQISAFF